MKVFLVKPSDLDGLRWKLLDRSQLRVRIENALRVTGVSGGKLTEETDKVVEGLEQWVRRSIEEWTEEVSR